MRKSALLNIIILVAAGSIAASPQGFAGAEVSKSLRPSEVVSLAQSLRPFPDTMKPARRRLINAISEQYLRNDAMVRSMPLANWRTLAEIFRTDLTASERGQWAERLRGSFAPNTDSVKAVTLIDVTDLAVAIYTLGEAQGLQLVVDWFELSGAKTIVKSVDTMCCPVSKLALADKVVAQRLVKAFDSILVVWHTNTPLGERTCNQFRRACLIVGCDVEARQWAMRRYSAMLGSAALRRMVDVKALSSVGRMLIETGMVGAGKDYPEFAAALAALAARGTLEGGAIQYEYLGAPLATEQTRKVVQAELVAGNGKVRLGVAKVLSWAYKTSGELDAWDEYLDQKANDQNLPADTRAMWLVARAYSASIGPGGRFGARQWENRALQVAASDSCKLRVLREFVGRYGSGEHYDEAVELLDGAAAQFAGTQAAASLDKLHEATIKRRAAYLRREAGVIGARAAYFEAAARNAVMADDKPLATVYEQRAEFYRERHKQLLLKAAE